MTFMSPSKAQNNTTSVVTMRPTQIHVFEFIGIVFAQFLAEERRAASRSLFRR
jgi:hypothetical protein